MKSLTTPAKAIPVIHPKLKQEIIKLKIMAQLVIEECDRVMQSIDKPVSKRAENKQRSLAANKADLIRRLTKKR